MSEWGEQTVEMIALNAPGAIKIGPFGSQLHKSEMRSEGFKVYGQENVIENNFFAGDRFISSGKFHSLKSCQLFPGDLVVTMMGTIGKVSIVPDNIAEGVMDSHLLRIQLNPKYADPSYTARVLSSSAYIARQIQNLSQGGIMSGLNAGIVRKLKLPLPPLDEQRRIAAILDASDAAIRATEAVIEKLRATNEGAVRAAILEATKGTVPIASLGEIVTGSTPSPSQPRFWNGQVPFITPGEIQADGVVVLPERKLTGPGCLQARMVPARSVLVVCIGSTYGKVGVFNGECATNQQINALIPAEGYHPLLIAQLVRNAFPQMSALAGLQAVPIINKNQFSKLAIPDLSAKDHESIGMLIEYGIAAIAAEESKVAKLRLQHQGLLHDLLTGTVRVSGSAA